MKIRLDAMTPDGRWVHWQTIDARDLETMEGIARLCDQLHEAGYLSVRLPPLRAAPPPADVTHGARRRSLVRKARPPEQPRPARRRRRALGS
jgi:hypothetical protein